MRNLMLVMMTAALIVSGCGSFFFPDTSCANAPDYVPRFPEPPSGAEILSESCQTGINPAYRVNYVVPADQFDALMTRYERLNISDDLSLANIFADEAARVTSGFVGRFGDGAYLSEVLIDTSHPDRITVYYENVFVD